MGAWGRRHLPVSPEMSIRAQRLEEGGPPIWEAFMAELRSVHLGTAAPERSVIAELQTAFEAAMAWFGRLDILHNNAGGSSAQDRPVTECDPEQFWRVVRLNLFGVWLGCHYGIPALIKSGGGSVINMASGMAIEPMAGRDAYTAAKGGVVSLTRSMAVEYAPHNIRVNALAPGFTASERVKAQVQLLPRHQIEQLNRVNPLGLGEPENVAAFVAFLASDEARYTSGQIFQVNNEMRGI